MNDVKVCGLRGLVTWCPTCANWEAFTLFNPAPRPSASPIHETDNGGWCVEGHRLPEVTRYGERSASALVEQASKGVENTLNDDKLKKMWNVASQEGSVEEKDAALQKILVGVEGSNLRKEIRHAIDGVLQKFVSKSAISVVVDDADNTEETRALGILNVKLVLDPLNATMSELSAWKQLTEDRS